MSFLLEQTQITVYTQIADVSAGSQFIFMRFERPMSGIWRILIRNSLDIRETFHLWLPVRGFISDETYFLRPDPDTTITDPGNAQYPITVTAYDHTRNSILHPCQPRLQPFRADQAGSRCSGRQYFRGIRLGNTPHENVRHLRRRRPSRRSRGDPAALGSPLTEVIRTSTLRY